MELAIAQGICDGCGDPDWLFLRDGNLLCSFCAAKWEKITPREKAEKKLISFTIRARGEKPKRVNFIARR